MVSSEAQEKLDALDRLLALEQEEVQRRAEERQSGRSDKQLEAEGVLLRRAQVEDEKGALLGRVRIELCEDPARRGHLAPFAVRTGSVVFSREVDDAGRPSLGARGIVARKTPTTLSVVFDEAPTGRDRLSLIRDDDDVTLGRLRAALARVRSLDGRSAELVEVLIGARLPRDAGSGQLTAMDTELNEQQRKATEKAIYADDVALVHGPPGTGKTRVLVEVVRQLVGRGERVLCLCSSNAGVDHLAISLLRQEPELALARVGHPARVSDELEGRTLAGLTHDHERRQLAKKLVEEAFQILRQARRRSDRGRDAWRREREARVEAGRMFADARRLERQAVDEVLRTTRVLCGTLTGYASEVSDEEGFDVLVVDEASQALTAALLGPSTRVRRVVLAGDHRQLPPTVLSQEAEGAGLGMTSFDLLMGQDDRDAFSHMLEQQYRMPTELMQFPSERFYEGRLEAHPDVADRGLDDDGLAGFDASGIELVRPAWRLELLDTAGAGFDEDAPEQGASRKNPGEADQVERVVRELMAGGLAAKDLGVITPYSAQSAELCGRLPDLIELGLEVDSVDGFQGREKEVIVFSAVRSNPGGEVGFLADPRRLNVSITRAKRKLLVVGDSATLGSDPLWNAWIEHIVGAGRHRSVFEIL